MSDATFLFLESPTGVITVTCVYWSPRIMVELRKRPAPPAAPPPAKKKAAPKKSAKKDAVATEEPAAEKPAPQNVNNGAAESAAKEAVAETAKKASKGAPPKQGETVELGDFGGEIETNDGEKTTLAKLLQDSKAGVVLFTYPKASTPGCKRAVPTKTMASRS